MKSKLFIACASLALLASCKQNPNGNYIAFEARTLYPVLGGLEDLDPSASDKLSSEIQGKVYNLEFDKDYIVLTDAKNQKMVLNRRIENSYGGNSDTSFRYSNVVDGQKAEFTLRPRYSNGEHKVDMRIEVYAKAIDSMGNLTQGRCARIASTLKKLNSN